MDQNSVAPLLANVKSPDCKCPCPFIKFHHRIHSVRVLALPGWQAVLLQAGRQFQSQAVPDNPISFPLSPS